MISLENASQIAAIVSAMADVYSIGRATFSQYLIQRENAKDYVSRGEALQKALSSYDDDEIEAIEKRIRSCKDRFIREGSGQSRKTCLCSVLTDVKDGNGGNFPFPEWGNLHEQLGC
ncbi:hypothetical protein [Ancylobacter radicis]|uniref:Uncharacterized protein n=1 Tax=Ancylobacter radicis TaxID=2836179 RepID=A0ABS5R7W1_9HYPH|nr:hypothetical protein [Ancylobacter radicis]MBS9477750.1 hypothetical protein [Ancylobacter radicis]